MKKLVMLFLCFFAFIVGAMAIEVGQDIPTGIGEIFASLGSLILIVPVITQFLKKWFKIERDLWKQVISWVVSILLVVIGELFNLGMFASIDSWFEVIGYGIGIGLVINGIFDIDFVKAFLQALFNLKKKR